MKKSMEKFTKHFSYGHKGFTLVELLVVIAILGVIAAVAVPNVGKFVGKGKSESYEAELHNVQTAAMAMMVDSTASQLDAAVPATNDMDTVTADAGAKILSSYMVGLNSDGTVKSGCTYAFAVDGTVTQATP